MRRGLVAFFALSLVGLGVTGCGLFRFEQREPWRAQAEEACLSQRLVQPSAHMALSSKIDGPGVCGMDYPFKVSAFNNGAVGLKSKVTPARGREDFGGELWEEPGTRRAGFPARRFPRRLPVLHDGSGAGLRLLPLR